MASCADRDHLEGDHVHLPRIDRGEIIRQAQALAGRLAREVEAGQLAGRCPRRQSAGS